MCSLRRVGEKWELFGVESIPVKNGNQHLNRFLGEDFFPQMK